MIRGRTKETIRDMSLCSPNCDGFDQMVEIIKEIDKENKHLIDELYVAKNYFELAMDRSDPYPPIENGLHRLKEFLLKLLSDDK